MLRSSNVKNPLMGITVGMNSLNQVLTDQDTTGFHCIASLDEIATLTLTDEDGATHTVTIPAQFTVVLGEDVKTVSSDVAVYIA